MSLTHQQASLLRFIDGYQKANGGASPSYQEMAGSLGLSAKSGAYRLMMGLIERGFVRRDLGRRARCIEIIKMPDASEVAAPLKTTSIQAGNRCPHCDGVISIPFRGTIS